MTDEQKLQNELRILYRKQEEIDKEILLKKKQLDLIRVAKVDYKGVAICQWRSDYYTSLDDSRKAYVNPIFVDELDDEGMVREYHNVHFENNEGMVYAYYYLRPSDAIIDVLRHWVAKGRLDKSCEEALARTFTERTTKISPSDS